MNSARSILFIQILLLAFSDLANSEVFDVTTLYKFEKSLVPVVSEEVFDVSTLYKFERSLVRNVTVGKTENKYQYNNKARIEVHAHNNALSLPFLLNNGTVAEPNLGIDTESNILTAFDNDKWEKKNILPDVLWGNNPFKNKDGTYSVYLLNNVTDAMYLYYSNNEMKITAKHSSYNSNSKFAIFLIGDKGSITSSDMYYIYFTYDRYGHRYHHRYGQSYIFIYKCTDNQSGDGSYTIPSGYTRRCSQKHKEYVKVHRRYITEIPEEKKSKPLQVKLQAHSSESFHILRIAGCNGDDLEDVLLLSESEEVDLLKLQGYDVTIPRDSNNLETCVQGHYGADCKESCGHCKNEMPCDPYTGLCPLGCETGFYLPFCKEKYKYVTVAPQKESLEYYSMKIKFTLNSENQAGIGNPWFYQVQYREHDNSNRSWVKASTHEIGESAIIFNITGLKPATKYDTRVIIINNDGGSYQGEDIPTAVFRTNCEGIY
ncbi:hypothetical protein C0J52_19715 [Blattella germanica]|nr:hypothetical protein C0J52_19715 [Blattella germanica]